MARSLFQEDGCTSSLALQPSDLVITSVVPVTASSGRRGLGAVASNATGSSLLTVWLLLQPSYGISTSLALSTINTAPVPALLSKAVLDALTPYASVALQVSAPAAVSVPLYPSISSTGPSSNGNVPVAPSSPPGPSFSVAGLIAGLILGAVAVFLLFIIFYTRATGGRAPCGLRACEGAIILLATCCGLAPMRKRRPTSSGPTGLPKVKSWRAAPQVAAAGASSQGPMSVPTANPLQSSLSLRSVNVTAGPEPK